MKILLLLFCIFIYSLFGESLQKIRVQLQWKHQFEFAGFYAAKEKGFYKELGFDVEFLEYENSISITDTVLENNAEFGLTYSSLISEYLKGKPVVFIANYFKQSPLVLIAQKEIQTPAQLKGKKVMGISNDIDSVTLKLMLEKFGISLKDIQSVKASFNINDFIDKKVDAMAIFTTNEIYELDKKNVSYKLFNPSVYGSEYYDLNLFTSKKFALQNPATVRKFKEATNRGWAYALENQDEIIDIILKKYNTQAKTKEALAFEAKQIESLMLSHLEEIGSIDVERLYHIAENFIESGYVSDKYLNVLKEIVFQPYKTVFSQEEEQFLDTKENITVCVHPNWEPYEKLSSLNGYTGMVAEFLDLISTKMDKKFKIVPTSSWEESQTYFKQGKCELIPFLNETFERKKYMNFTQSLFEEFDVFVTKHDIPYIDHISFLNGKTIGLVKGHSREAYISKNYPKIKIRHCESHEECFALLSNKEIDATIDALFGSSFLIRKLNLVDVKIAGKTELMNQYKMGVKKDNPILLSILSKSINNISSKEKEKILSNWMTIKYEQGFDYNLLWKIIVGVLFILVLLYHRQYAIKKINIDLQAKMQKQLKEITDKDKMIFQQSKLIAMGEMIQNIAHQWRQPLSEINATIMTIDNLIHYHKIKDQNLEKELLHIEELTLYMSSTIDYFKNFFLQNDKIEKLDINEAIEHTLKIIQKVLEHNKIELIINLEKDIYIKGNKSELAQVLLILINNSKDALIAKQIKNPYILIEMKGLADEYILEISDNGGGVNEDIICRIFEPYFTTKHKSQGTGLGLYIAKMIIETKLNGKLNAHNTDKGLSCHIQFIKEKNA